MRLTTALGAAMAFACGLTGCGGSPAADAPAASPAAHNDIAIEPKVVLVTFDGIRWEEVFRGADPALVEAFVHADIKETATAAYVAPEDRHTALMPFLHETIARQGVVVGDRDAGECARVANDMWFSYPGYTEILAGKPNPDIVENDPIPNPHVTVLEWANKDPDFAGRVQMAGTWTLFPYIANAERSGVPVNAAFGDRHPTDVMTARAGFEHLAKDKPRLLYIAFGDTDELAHLGDYHGYLSAIERGDEYLRMLWERIESDPFYRGQTTLIVTTDHGRGNEPADAWRDHSSPRYHDLNPEYDPRYNGVGVVGADAIWVAAIGPSVTRDGAGAYRGGPCALQAQVAKSVVAALGRSPDTFAADAAEPFAFISAPRH